jgi:hypothetical protein
MKNLGVIEIPNALNSEFDHAAFDPRTRRVFIAHTARDCIEVIDHDAGRHIATLPRFPGVAGAVADDGEVLATNRCGASVAWFDATTYETKGVFKCGRRPNGVAIVYAACDDGALVEVDSGSGKVTNVWPIAGPPDVTFFNPATGLVHVAIGEQGLVETIDPRTGTSIRTMTGAGAHTTAIVIPDRLYVISPKHGGVLVLADA